MRLNAPPKYFLSDDFFISRKSRHADLVCPVPGRGDLARNPLCESLKSDRKKREAKEYARKLGAEYMQTVPGRGECSETPKHKTQ